MVVSDDDDDDDDDDDIDCFGSGGQDVKNCFVAVEGGGEGEAGVSFVGFVLLLLSDTWRVNAGRAGRLPQMIPQVISAMLLVRWD